MKEFLAHFNLDEGMYAAICSKMKASAVTPYKMLHDSSFVEFEIPTANGNKNVRKEVSDLIIKTNEIAAAVGIENPGPKEYGTETLEEYVGRIRAELANKLKAAGIIS